MASENETSSTSSPSKPTVKTEDYVEDGKNKLSIYCFRCQSLILKSQVGSYKPDVEFNLPKMTQKKDSPSVETDALSEWFLVEEIFQFENVGFSKSQNGIKYLVCSDCEYGPIGWFKDKKSFVAIDRVRFES